MQNLLKNHAEKLRFALVGSANTAIDFGLLFAFVAFGLPVIASNFVSTSVALTFSFFANKTFTFKDDSKNHGSQLVNFLIITLFGLWVIQPIIIEGTKLLTSNLSLNNSVVLLIGKLLATAVTLIWNYLLYRKFVYKKQN